ncbi:MAG: hypothetical protein AAGE52_01340 [Myxococcota bacterium]
MNWTTVVATGLLGTGGVLLAIFGGAEWATTAGVMIAGAVGLAAPTSAVNK